MFDTFPANGKLALPFIPLNRYPPPMSQSFLFLLTLTLFLSQSFGQESKVNGIAAVVNGKVITKSELQDAINAQRQMILVQARGNYMDPEVQKELAAVQKDALDNLIDRELILGDFAKSGGTIREQFVDDDINNLIRQQFKGDRDAFVIELAKTGMTMKKFRDLRQKMMIVSVMRNKQVGLQPPATPKEVEDMYQKNIERYRDKDMLKISTITIARYTSASTPEKQKQLAEEIRSKVVAGADFATMARTYSEDSRKEDGGSWEWMERKAMKKSMADAAFALKDGGVSKVIDDEAAFIIIALEAKKLGTATPLEKVRPEIEKMISNERGKSLVEAWIKGLQKKAVIRRF
jgi:peptidyl-prolyl cis-trans isomerase SurA